MKTVRWLSTVSFMLLAGLALWLSRSEAQPGTVKQIAPGVWFREGEIKEMGHSNNVIIEMKDYLIVVDANFPSGARAVLADAKRLSAKPVRYVFDTHHHGDHAYGNPVWTQLGAITIAHIGVAEELKRYEPKRWQEAARTRQDVAELKLETAEPPKQTFSRSPHVISDGARRVEFHFFGWAHTRGDGFVYLPREKVLCTGDAAVNGPFNYTGDGNLGNWPNVIARAQKLDVKHVLPGHGGPGGREILEGQARFFRELLAAVRQAVQEGKKLEDLVTLQEGRPVATSVRLSDSVRNWVGDSLPAQVRDAYEEITQGKPHGEILGGQ
jgi:glyoxylase-like metal-dependent hydrolase (beta-lactamase superfamily II)